jgi:subtilase family serine protease
MLGLLRYPQGASRKHSHPNRLRLEELESRTLLTAYTPSQIRHAYGFDRLPYDGSGQTIAIVTAYDDPSLSYDLGVFDQLYNLPDPVLTIAKPQGQPAYDHDWGLETDLDVEWAHAIAPGANILVVEAVNTGYTFTRNNLMAAVFYAREQPGVVAVSMSWGSVEDASEVQNDNKYFTTPAGHIGGSGLPGGVTFVSAAGDSGAEAEYPSASPNVLSIGGTTLNLDDNNDIASETGWSGSGGGVSSYESEPDYQQLFQMSGMRTVPDVSYNADLNTAYFTYDSDWGGTQAVYGTSAGAPQWAALIALVDQGLASNGIGSLDGATQTIPALYNLASVSYGTYYHDIVDGNNGYAAGPGYDLVTGLGSPVADQLVEALVNGPQAPGGGAHARGSLGVSPFSRAGVTPIAFAPISLPGFGAMPTPLSEYPGSVSGGTLVLVQQPVTASAELSQGRIESGRSENGMPADNLDNDSVVDRITLEIGVSVVSH